MTSKLRATACYCGQFAGLAMARWWAILSLMLAGVPVASAGSSGSWLGTLRPRCGNRVRRFPGPALSGSGASWVRGSGAESSESRTIQPTPKRSSGIPRAGNDPEAVEPTLKAGNDPRAGIYLVGRESLRPNTKANGENSPDPTSGPAVILPPIQYLDQRRESPRPKTKTSGENSPSQRMPPGRQAQQALS